MSTVKTLNVGAWFAERDRVNRRLVRSLVERGRWDVAEQIFGDDAAGLLAGSAPRLREVTSRG